MHDNKQNIDKKEKKTYSIGSLFIAMILFVIVISIFTFARNVKANEILMELSKLDNEIERLEKEVKVLSAEEAEYSSPNRFIETAIINGFTSVSGDNNDILYLKIEDQNNNNDQ
ncbi:septation ring formation regulator EzrA [Brachyspira hyodysenteriae]|uniref:Septum formation initiator n=1 Tax=Brachyspira hyodysenteriae (strain ATCC 49526 / WA1) TaxID=565034 RepID=A0A3B6V7V5_BRAHW|nr:LapA family protein [Brachyspira hyodysenteriae]ACN82600.1 Septum formation initiator [Brachyspira hyodysenteriae WA1]AUJ50925.1 septation ring formation regulator EzrA [Brachyspira hyodysenteriae]KLI13344.1 septation ring formation regulator EzrA [Brachyspira hyodysenteriae]KLI14169.1 septation ring formation regulator EzrA [Brachyspira hyodysenteriae]KLI15707.1 septation ring formation regulator EzrA [Brachyspira hyodysenteriae]